jgi:hypothetical protein
MRKLSFEKIALAILTAASALRRLPLMSISRSEFVCQFVLNSNEFII